MNGLLIAAILMSLFGLVFVIIGIISNRRAALSKTWPTAPGEILNSTIVQHESTDSDGASSTSYEPVVEYRYNVIGSPFTGKRIAYGANQFSYNIAQKIISRYPIGSSIQVHYNPEKPADAVLETKSSGGTIFLIVGIVIIIAAVVIYLFF